MSSTIPKNVNIWGSSWSRTITRENPHPNGFKNGFQLTTKFCWKLIKINESDHQLLWDPRRDKGLPEWYHRGNIKTHQGEFQKIYYSVFPLGLTKLCNMNHGGKKLRTFSAGSEWLYRPDFHHGSLQGRFSRGTETGCIKFWMIFL